ncbi:MAG TPA: aminotransferase class I/II-fold pyridoxal phosphate-dependent enzyme [Thermoplasmata archaeon]|nr:aminotransferase class I/II-fold pyridoxal phosphate-dependent enzyme [Thermoplasmata archaeon]
MGFPLGDWIDSHAGARHNLGQSGMRGSLETPRRALRGMPEPDLDALRHELAQTVGVAPTRLFLTHGATEGNTAVAFYLAQGARRRGRRLPRVRLPIPEYPPLTAAATWAGFAVTSSAAQADLVLLSDPNNPTGRRWRDEEFDRWRQRGRSILVDETFREFTSARSRARAGRAGLWTTGTFTKAYGGDAHRVGYVVAPEEEADRFAAFHGVLLDGLAEASVRAARALLRARPKVLGEARALFRSNLRVLREAVPGVPALDAPLWFDRAVGGDGDRLARRLLRASVLVCPGSFFGDASGVRICLTRRTFPIDLMAYLRVRDRTAR